MKKRTALALIAMVSAVLLGGCGQNGRQGAQPATTSAPAPARSADTATLQPAVEESPAPPAEPEHHYAMRDGSAYGYERAISQAAMQEGQGAQSLLMFKYAGHKGDTWEAFNRDGDVISVIACTEPCEFAKVMTFANGRLANKEHMRLVEGTIASAVMADARNGMLEPYVLKREGKPHHVWFSEEEGVQVEPLGQ